MLGSPGANFALPRAACCKVGVTSWEVASAGVEPLGEAGGCHARPSPPTLLLERVILLHTSCSRDPKCLFIPPSTVRPRLLPPGAIARREGDKPLSGDFRAPPSSIKARGYWLIRKRFFACRRLFATRRGARREVFASGLLPPPFPSRQRRTRSLCDPAMVCHKDTCIVLLSSLPLSIFPTLSPFFPPPPSPCNT